MMRCQSTKYQPRAYQNRDTCTICGTEAEVERLSDSVNWKTTNHIVKMFWVKLVQTHEFL
jgi:hypothetical protein